MPIAHALIPLAQALLLVASGFFSASETALFGLSYNDRLQLRKRSPRAAAIVERLLTEPRSLLVALLMANMTVNVVFLALGSVLLLSAENKALAAGANAATVFALIAFGEVVPKLVAASARVRIVQFVAPLVLVLHRALTPMRRFAETIVIAPLARLFHTGRNLSGGAGDAALTVAELSALVELGASEGAIARDEQQLLAEVVELGTIRIRDIMAPRVNIHWLSATAKPEDVTSLVRRTGVTHIPVYRVSPDKEVVGILDARRYLGAVAAGRSPRLADALLPAVYVPETAPLDKLLPQFGRGRADVLLCVDEYGTIDGLIRIADVADRLVAKFAETDAIAAEMDELAEQGVRRIDESRWSIPGRLGVREWAELFGEAIDRRVSTVGGLVMSRLGRIPRVGDRVEFSRVAVRVASLRGNLIERLEVTFRNAQAASPAGAGA